MKEPKFVEKTTDNLLLSLAIGFGLIIVCNYVGYLVGGGASFIAFALNILGLYFIIKSIWKATKQSRPQLGNIKTTSINKQFIIGIFVPIVVVTLLIGIVYSIKYISRQKYISVQSKYEDCINECSDNNLTGTQRSVCKVDCIRKYK
ncbi:MAG: hypothetical protein WC508_00455 [Patescibacteria group bacterium]